MSIAARQITPKNRQERFEIFLKIFLVRQESSERSLEISRTILVIASAVRTTSSAKAIPSAALVAGAFSNVALARRERHVTPPAALPEKSFPCPPSIRPGGWFRRGTPRR